MRLRDGFLDYSEIKPSTHDLRKSFVSYMAPKMHNLKIGNRTLTENDIRFITHLDEGKTSTASVTYDKSEYLDVKQEILATWEAYIKMCAGPKNHSLHTMAKGFAKTPEMVKTIKMMAQFAEPDEEDELESISKMMASSMFGSTDNQISDDFDISDFEDS